MLVCVRSVCPASVFSINLWFSSCAGLKGLWLRRIRPSARNAWEPVQDWDLPARLWEPRRTVSNTDRHSQIHSWHISPFLQAWNHSFQFQTFQRFSWTKNTHRLDLNKQILENDCSYLYVSGMFWLLTPNDTVCSFSFLTHHVWRRSPWLYSNAKVHGVRIVKSDLGARGIMFMWL